MNTDQLQICVTGQLPKPQIEIASAAYEARRIALQGSGTIRAIASVADLDAAAGALKGIKSITRAVEDSRKTEKAPVLEVGKRIDAVAKEYLAPLEAEAARLSVLVGSYQEAERRKAERIRAEEAAAQAAALAEMQAKQDAAMATGDLAAADAAREEAADKIAESQIAVSNAEGPKADGIVTRTNWKFEVNDIEALYRAHPELCIITPNNAAIRAIIKTTRSIPGLRIWQEAGAIVRGTSPVKIEDFDY